MRVWGVLGIAFGSLLGPVGTEGSAAAAEVMSAEDGVPLVVHGFVSGGYIKTTANNYLARTSDLGSFEFAELGINFTTQLSDRLRLGLQLFTRDLGPVGNYTTHADWFYLDYRWRDWLGLRAGRVKLPFGLYNDTSDIDSARVPVLLPQSVYPASNRDVLLAQTGGELYGYVSLRRAGALDYRVYGGTIFLDTAGSPPGRLAVIDLVVPYVLGGRLMWDTPLDGLRVGGSLQVLRLETDLLDTVSMATFRVNIPATLWVASAEYTVRDWLVAGEYSRWSVRTESGGDPTVFPSSSQINERGYVMTSARLTSWLQPGVYYALLFSDVAHRSAPGGAQHDWAATLRFDLSAHWLVKVEGHFMHGAAALTPALNGNVPPANLAQNWGVLLVKTTAYF